MWLNAYLEETLRRPWLSWLIVRKSVPAPAVR
jgi:hypothetical protein